VTAYEMIVYHLQYRCKNIFFNSTIQVEEEKQKRTNFGIGGLCFIQFGVERKKRKDEEEKKGTEHIKCSTSFKNE
jgi:hypothetical protein